MKDFEAEDSAQPGFSGATGIFGVLADEAPKKAAAAAAAPVASGASEETLVSPPQNSAASGVGFTQLLRTLTLHEPLGSSAAPTLEAPKASEAAPAPVFSSVAPTQLPVVPSQPAAPAGASSAGGFTQMFEAVQPQPAAAVFSSAAPTPAARAAPVGASAGAGGFTQLFQALESPAPNQAAPVNAPPARAAEVLAAPAGRQPEPQLPVPAPQVARTEAVPFPAVQTGGFTALFRSLDTSASVPQGASVEPQPTSPVVAVASPMAAPSTITPPSPGPTIPSTAGTYSAGGITQLLRAIDMSGVEPSKPPASPSASPIMAGPGAAPAAPSAVKLSSNLPLAIAPPLIEPAPPSVPASAASSLTGIFQTTPSPSTAPEAPAAAEVPRMPQQAGAPPFFGEAPPVARAFAAMPMPADSPVIAAPPAPGASFGATGSFTQLFRALDDAGPTPSARAPEPQSSFTQIFSSESMQPTREASQADSFPPLPPSGGAGRAEFGAGADAAHSGGAKSWEEPRFSTPPTSYPTPQQTPPQYAGVNPLAQNYPEPQSRLPESPAASGMGSGGLTQLLRTLDGPASSAAPSQPIRAESVFGPPPVSARPDPLFGASPAGSTGATTAFRLPQVSAAPAAPAAPAGPGEFTRIIQASALRENARQGGGGAPGAVPPAAAAAPAGGSPVFSVSSSGMPGMPAAPVLPAMPTMGAGGGGGGFAMPQMPTAPAMPSVPNLTVTAPATAAPAAGGGSKLLPILLIVVIVLLVAVLLAVVLMMKK